MFQILKKLKHKKVILMQLKYICNFVQRRRKLWRTLGNFQEHISWELLKRFPSILIYEIVYMWHRKCINLVEINLVVLEIQKAEFGNFTVPVNNTLVCCMSSFAFVFLGRWHTTVCLDLHINHVIYNTLFHKNLQRDFHEKLDSIFKQTVATRL